MTDDQEKLLADFEFKMRQLMFLCDSQRNQIDALCKELEIRDLQIISLENEIEQLKLKYENLKFAKALVSEDKEDVQKAKQRLSKLVRDVDKCIALLKV